VAGSDVIQIMCPKLTCRRILAVPVGARGKKVRCRGCGSTVRVPQAKVGPIEVAPVATTETKADQPAS
jgi:hypothetical protein